MIYDVKSVSKIKEDNDSFFMFFSTFYGIRIDIKCSMFCLFTFFETIVVFKYDIILIHKVHYLLCVNFSNSWVIGGWIFVYSLNSQILIPLYGSDK